MEEITQKIYLLIYPPCGDVNKSQDITEKTIGLSEKSFDNIVAILENKGFSKMASETLADDILKFF